MKIPRNWSKILFNAAVEEEDIVEDDGALFEEKYLLRRLDISALRWKLSQSRTRNQIAP
jgi:hypothetical protein